ncbi:transcriptional regulator, partial [Streptomyces sp. SID5785]|nr:transcriptional regulator [Streptomyces sp. SID5785]
AARELAEAAVAGPGTDDAWSLPYALAALARVLMWAGEPGRAAGALDRAERSVGTGRDRQARFEVRTARAELALFEERPERVAELLPEGEAPVLTAWAHLLAGRRESARSVAAAEVARARGTGERIAEVDAGVVHAVALGGAAGVRALGAVEALARSLPYPAGLGRIVAARGIPGTG